MLYIINRHGDTVDHIKARFAHNEVVYIIEMHAENVARGDKLSFQNVGGVRVSTMY